MDARGVSVEHDCLLVKLPTVAGDRVAWWRTAPGGGFEHGEGPPPEPPVPRGNQDARRRQVVLAVPGVDCTVRWLELRAHTTVQAAAAARALLAGQLAVDPEGLHVAVAADGRDRWLVVAVDPPRMDDWLEQARLLGLQPDCLVPAPLLLPLPAGRDAPEVTVVRGQEQKQDQDQDHWLVRGDGVAFAAEPALAAQLLAAYQQVPLADPGAAMAAATANPPVNLRQGRYALRNPAAGGTPNWRRTRRLAVATLALALLSPALLAAAHHWQAARLERQAAHEAANALPTPDNAITTLRTHLAATRTTTDFGNAMAALLSAIEQSPATSLDALSWHDGLLSATVEHAGGTSLQPLAAALPAAGFQLAEHETSLQSGIAHTRVSLEPAP
ncbi:type II secretion system protein GspL [Lysobacter sp. GX 14042]|uniref:type II secretion system protein GspL n=1 Tax=Lysobacter sp. GX 14042 TaxID=2907155 RepID=UPI001F2078B7|nr:type II secretion system protein GspL [Lysobacter sp. GX 14042]MCE7033200.1 type II secretion system protein GspL [Lysobacter sp. GX 14042]